MQVVYSQLTTERQFHIFQIIFMVQYFTFPCCMPAHLCDLKCKSLVQISTVCFASVEQSFFKSH